MSHTPSTALVLLAVLVAGVPAVHAQGVPTGAPYSQIDPNTFILGHPASPHWKVVHAGSEHPAVLVARRAAQPPVIDPNLFPVQPPASVRWLASGDEAGTVVAVRR